MKIFINGRFLTHRITGVQRYALEIIKAIDLIAEDYSKVFEFIVLYPARSVVTSLFKIKHVKLRGVGKLTGHAWEQFELPVVARGEILLNLCGSGPILHRKSVNILHDATIFAAPEAFSKSFTFWYRILQPVIAQRAWILGTVSNFSKGELERYLKLNGKMIAVLPNGTEHIEKITPDLDIVKKFNISPFNYITTLASNQMNKNVRQLIRIAPELFLKFGLSIVVVGGSYSKSLSGITLSKINSDVIFTGYLSDQEMIGIIKQSFCFVFPSKYEGFGIPPLEAMCLGVPVITCNAASLPEVCGQAALYFDIDDDKGLIMNINRLVLEPSLREKLQNIGYQQIKKFSWLSTTRNLLSLILNRSLKLF